MSDKVAIVGVGMHPWGRWRHSFVDYGLEAARKALADANVSWTAIQFVAAAATMRCGYPGWVAGSTFAQALGWQGAEVSTTFAGCASGGHALAAARAKILARDCDLALVVGADVAPDGPLLPIGERRPDDLDWVRFHLGLTNPVYLALWARRRMHLYGTTAHDFCHVRLKNAAHGVENGNARYRRRLSLEQVMNSPMIADPLRMLHISSLSDGGAAVVVASPRYARKLSKHPTWLAAISTASPQYTTTTIDLPALAANLDESSNATSQADSLVKQAYERSGLGPEDLSVAEIYDLSSALELDWYEHLGLCPRGAAEQLLRSGATTIGGRIPTNPSGGLACFGEALAPQALAQVCEITWQLRGLCGRRQVTGARVGVAASVGVFGHGSCAILVR